MQRFKTSLLVAAGLLVLALVLTAIGPKRVMAALGYTPVRDVDNPGRNQFQRVFQLNPSSIANEADTSFTVPAGKVLVMDFVSALMFNNSSGNVFVGLGPEGIVPPGVYVPVTQPGANINGLAANQPIVLYAQPGSTVTVEADFNPSPFADACVVTLTGHYINVP